MVGRARRGSSVNSDGDQDAAGNPGSSGGALAEARGRIVCINTTVAGAGLGLAVSVNATPWRIIAALLKDNCVRRAYLGLVNTPIQLLPSAVVRTKHREGFLVVEVLAGSPAEREGLRAGDVLLSVGEKAVSDAESLQMLLFPEAIGVPLELAVLRDGSEIRVLTFPEEMGNEWRLVVYREVRQEIRTFPTGLGAD